MNIRRKFSFDISQGIAVILFAIYVMSCNVQKEKAFIAKLLPAPVGEGFEIKDYHG